MQIIIPMSGYGERFRQAGYILPKALIPIEGKPMIAHVIDMFPGEKDFIFICNKEHLNNVDYGMEATIKKYCPTARVVGINPHKLGPVHAVLEVKSLLSPDSPAVVNYCDFSCYWDWGHFKKFIKTSRCIGALPAYKDFHPHSLGSTNYAYIKHVNGWLEDIKEKESFTENRMEEFASSGTYYFLTARIMIEAFQEIVDKQINVGGEYYVSLAYKPLLEKKCSIAVYPLQHFMQWGTPEDLNEYQMWSATFRKLIIEKKSHIKPKGSIIVPMAGMGKRFSDEGCTLPKPLIKVSGLPMAIQSVNCLPLAEKYVFILRSEMLDCNKISEALKKKFPNSIVHSIEGNTDGQARTTMIGLNFLCANNSIVEEPITIGVCDSGVVFDETVLNEITKDNDVDVLVWGIRNFSNAKRNPNMYAWIDLDDKGVIKKVSVKKPLSNLSSDPIVLGIFTFKNIEKLHASLEKLFARSGKVNGEFYLDSCINDAIEMGLTCKLFEVEDYLCWGTPNDLKIFEYWQSCFHKWKTHPYQIEKDNLVPKMSINELIARYAEIKPALVPPREPE
jgi:NDP-sugar pyrophosphorylase family protein